MDQVDLIKELQTLKCELPKQDNEIPRPFTIVTYTQFVLLMDSYIDKLKGLGLEPEYIREEFADDDYFPTYNKDVVKVINREEIEPLVDYAVDYCIESEFIAKYFVKHDSYYLSGMDSNDNPIFDLAGYTINDVYPKDIIRMIDYNIKKLQDCII